MNNRKRPAPEPLLPLRLAKQPRKTLFRSDGEPASPSEYQGILSRWIALGREFWKLGVETVFYIIPGALVVKIHESNPTRLSLPPPNPTISKNLSILPPPKNLKTMSNEFDGSSNLQPETFSSIGDMGVATTSLQSNSEEERQDPENIPRPNYKGRQRSISQHPYLVNQVNPPNSLQAPSELHRRSVGTSKSGEENSVEQHVKYVRINQALEELSLQTGAESSSSNKKRQKEREHIYARAHRRNVQLERKLLREELQRELYQTKRKSGFTSGYSDFMSLLQFQALLHRLGKDGSNLSSQSLDNLRGKATEPQRSRRYSLSDEDDTAFLQRALANAKATLNSPKPPEPFTPTLEQRRRVNKLKDEELETRLRPKLPTSLPPNDEEIVNNLVAKRGVISRIAREQVTDQDLYRLRPRQWLNDEIINFYGALILARSDECKENPGNGDVKGGKKKPLNVHYFSTFFWTKLRKEGYDKGRLAKWTKKLDLFAKDAILIPVNHNNAHWTGAAINFRKKRIESYDSMGMAKEEVFKHLRAYLDAEHRNKRKKPFDFTGWENYAPDLTPQQENGYDCGVFTCQFLEALSRGEESFIFTQKDMPYLRRRMIWEIGQGILRDD